MNEHVRIGTRASLLARRQTDGVVDLLQRRWPNIRFEIVTIRTDGDTVVDRPIDRIGGEGVFTRRIERALHADQIDLAVHSLKDLPIEPTEGLILGAVPRRDDPRDALVGMTAEQVRGAASPVRIGTGSIRRAAQLRRLFPNAEIVEMRGNVDTRLRKIDQRTVDCTVLAAAGLKRLGRGDRIATVFEPDQVTPAAAQGALAVQIRQDDESQQRLVSAIHCPTTDRCVRAERALLHRLGAGCHAPVGALATSKNATIHLTGRVISLDGTTIVDAARSGPDDMPEQLGEALANELLDRGAGDMIKTAQHTPLQGEDND